MTPEINLMLIFMTNLTHARLIKNQLAKGDFGIISFERLKITNWHLESFSLSTPLLSIQLYHLTPLCSRIYVEFDTLGHLNMTD